MCSVCIHGDLLLLNHAGLKQESCLQDKSPVTTERTTMTLHHYAYYHLHRETGFMAKLQLLRYSGFVPLKLTCVILPSIDIQYTLFPVDRVNVRTLCPLCLNPSAFAVIKAIHSSKKKT